MIFLSKKRRKFIKWYRKNRLEFFGIVFIFLLASFLRFYHLAEYTTFSGDEGRNALVVKKILTEGQFPLIGPFFGGDIYHFGPIYYYLDLLPLMIFNFNPLASAYRTAFLSLLSIAIIYYLAKKWCGAYAAFIAALLYAVSPVIIKISRSYWNPNPAPFFTLLAFFGLVKARFSHDFRWFILTGFSIGIAVQLHHTALILIPLFIVLWFIELVVSVKFKGRRHHFKRGTIFGILAFMITLIPYAISEYFSNFYHLKLIGGVLLQSNFIIANPLILLKKGIFIFYNNLITDYFAGGNPVVAFIIIIIMLGTIPGTFYVQFGKKVFCWSGYVLNLWIFFGILMISIFIDTIPSQYLGIISPAIYLMFAASLDFLIYIIGTNSKVLKVLVGLLVIFLVVINLQKNQLFSAPSNDLIITQEITQYIVSTSNNDKFNFILVSDYNNDGAYQYYFDLIGKLPQDLSVGITNQIYLVCEGKICKLSDLKGRVSNFENLQIEDQAQFRGRNVLKVSFNGRGRVKIHPVCLANC